MGTSITLDLKADTRFDPLGTGPNAWGTVEVTSQKEVAVQSFVDIGRLQKAVYSFVGLPAAKADTTVYAPLIRANQGSASSYSGVTIVNTTASEASVQITYKGDPASPTDPNMTKTATVTVPGSSATGIYHGCPVQAGDPVATAGCPKAAGKGWVGSATYVSTQPILVMVNDQSNVQGTAGAYNGVTMADASTKVSVPLVRHRHSGRTTGIQVFNPSQTDASVTVRYTGPAAQNYGSDTKTVPAGGSFTFLQSRSGNIPPNDARASYGSALIESDQPVLAIVNDAIFSGSTALLDQAVYNAIPLETP
jgi:hypothetical protein